jgi:hypothetical protein
LKTSELLETEFAALAHMMEGLTWNKESLGIYEQELNTSYVHGRWTGFKAQTKDTRQELRQFGAFCHAKCAN